jgi:hypothetical protein
MVLCHVWVLLAERLGRHGHSQSLFSVMDVLYYCYTGSLEKTQIS